jgi:hypothetical protein
VILRPVSWNAGRLLVPPNRSRGARHKPLYSSTPARLLSLRLGPFAARNLRACFPRAHRSAKYACRQTAHGRALELPGGPPRAFLPAVSAVAEQSGHRFPAAKKVHLKSVRLFLGAGLGVDATNVLFRIGISSFFHGLVPSETL